MAKGRVPRFAPWLPVLAVLAGGVVLGVLQVRWIGEASRAEETRLRGTLRRGVEQVRSHAEDEVRVLLSLARAATLALDGGDLSGATESMRLWQGNTRFPGLLRGMYLVRRPPDADVLAWSAGDGGFVGAALPDEVADAVGTALADAAARVAWPTVSLPDWRRIVVLPTVRRTTAGRASSAAAVAVDLDARVFYGEVVPFYMARNLAEFPWRIVDAADGSTIGASEGLAAGREPEAVEDLLSVAVVSLSRRDDPLRSPDGGPLVEPFLQAWLLRAQGEELPTEPRPPDQQPAAAEARLEVYYPGGTLAGTVRTRQALSLAVSLGLTGLLLAGVGVLTRLYRRSVRLRASEQEFVASVSHELRTPVAVIRAASDNLRTGAVSDPARLPRYAEVIHGQVRRLSSMVESILLYAGLESGMARRPVTATVGLPELLEEVLQPLAQLAAERGCRLALEAPSLPATACADRTALRLVIENLVANAVHHAGSAEIRLAVHRQPPDRLRIVVEDDGSGIPARERSRVFEPFVRGERSVREQRPGSGLGLHLVRRVVELQGGKVTLESPYRDPAGAERAGCRFVVELPFAERCDEA